MVDDKKILKNIGNKFKEAREAAKLLQSEVAQEAGINTNYYAQIERGEVNLSHIKLQRIAKALNIKSIDIL